MLMFLISSEIYVKLLCLLRFVQIKDIFRLYKPIAIYTLFWLFLKMPLNDHINTLKFYCFSLSP